MRPAVVPSIAGVLVAGLVGYRASRRFERPAAELALREPAPEPAPRPVPDLAVHVAGSLEALPKMQRRLKAVERSTAELGAIRKRLGDVSKSSASVAELSESLPRIEKRMREVSQATALLPELLAAVEKMTKSIDRLADRLPPPQKR